MASGSNNNTQFSMIRKYDFARQNITVDSIYLLFLVRIISSRRKRRSILVLKRKWLDEMTGLNLLDRTYLGIKIQSLITFALLTKA